MAGSGTAHLREGALLSVENLVVEYAVPNGRVHAVSDVSFDVMEGETLGLVGESGCGKSTTARAVVGFVSPSSGTIRFAGSELTAMRRRDLRALRTRIQMVFQDPVSSLNPRRTVASTVGAGLRIWRRGSRAEREERVRNLLERVGIDYEQAKVRRPHEYSGGQCQRISIVRSLVLEPRVLICDEPVSALDVSVQAQILNLLREMKESHALTMLFIAHDLSVVKNISSRVAVMYLGKICEIADPDELYARPRHPYTAALLAAVPSPDPTTTGTRARDLLTSAEVPSPIAPPSGCRFRTRCPRAEARCAQEEPEIAAAGAGHFVACHFPLTDPPADPSSNPPADGSAGMLPDPLPEPSAGDAA